MLIPLVLAGCEPQASSSLVAVRDSAGIDIVESLGPQWVDAGQWALDSIPKLSLDGAEPAFEFAGVSDATVLPDGRLVVLDSRAHEVRFFDEEGRFLSSMGREGEGPGDFDRLTSVTAFSGDSVLVFDAWLKRATILDGSGALGRILTLSPDLQVQELHPISGTEFIAKTWSLADFMEVAGPYRAQYDIASVGEDGRARATLVTVPGWNGFKVNRDGGDYSDFAPLFPIDTKLDVSAQGITVGTAERMEIARYSVEGILDRIIRVPSLDHALSSEEVAAEREAMVSPRSGTEYREIVRDLPAPELRPAYNDLLVDELGYTWAARYASPRRSPDDPVAWYVFEPNGAWLGTLTTPAKFRVFEIGSDYVLGARRDDYDVQHIELLRLARSQ